MAQQKTSAREVILNAAEKLIGDRGVGGVTIEQVARAAGSAKGLVHYHFKTKKGLLAALAKRLAQKRSAQWASSLTAENPREAIDRTWAQLTSESGSGMSRAWFSLVGSESPLTDQTVSSLRHAFVDTLTISLIRMLKEGMGLEPTVATEEIGGLMGAVIDGMALELLSGTEAAELEGAYAAAWLGILSLTAPAS